MTKYLIVLLLVRLVLPAALLLSVAVRPFGLSLVYLLLFVVAPLVQVPDVQTFKGARGKFLLLIVVTSFLLIAIHLTWHIVLAAFHPYCSLLDTYPLMESIGLNLGLVCYKGIPPLMAVHYLAPELVVATVSLLVYLAVKSLLTTTPAEIQQKDTKHQRFPLLTNAGKYLCLFLIMFSGIMRPSVTSGIYFLVFMGAATAWSLGQPLARGFAVVCRCVMAIMAVHVMVLLAYQWSWLIELYPPEKEFARYFGLTKLVIINETNPQSFSFEVTDDGMWATLASPFVILATYYILAIETRELFKPKVVYSHISSKALRGDAGETAPLMTNVSPKKQWSSIRSRSASRQLQQDSTGSVVVPDSDSVLVDEQPTIMDHIVTAVIDFFQVLVRSSYIATTITMMAWSIMFHSWLTFVFLMWANVVWLCQDQRSFMLKTSPVLVIYAMLLLLTQYVYGMNLTEAELPSNITEVNLHQIGVGRPEGEACMPLLIKSLFTCMFWITLRQRIQDIRQRRQSAAISDMAAPLQLTVSTAASVLDSQREEEHQSLLLQKIGQLLRAACARYWIYVVVIMLFVIGITGDRMTIFRILYMFLFLAFILMFQISWHWWRRLMYMFWIVVIIYSMINLILIYVYQFDNFSKMIEKYLLINERLQHDLGLDRYQPADLFVKLLTPTLFLIITIMQVHYFHKDFMALSNPRTRANSEVNREVDESSRRSPVGGASTMKDDLPPLPLEDSGRRSSHGSATELDHSMETTSNTAIRPPEQQRKSSARSRVDVTNRSTLAEVLKRAYIASRETIAYCIDKIFEYLDIHLIKIVIISLMLLCVMNVCAMHAPIMLIITPALWLNSRKQRVCVLLISTLISIYFMAKMVYQIDYIKHSSFDVNCTETDSSNTTTFNNAEWIGFEKSSRSRPLVVLLKGYIGIIAVLTFYSLVRYRQQANREGVTLKDKDKVMFPEISRKEADVDLVHCIKYLVNYGFYKFGVEVSLMCLMGVIGSRMDLYAVLYAAWLLVLVSIGRPRQMRVWPAFTASVGFLIPVQYMISVGFLPAFCFSYPWSGEEDQMKHIRTWLFLPYNLSPPHATKIIFDFFLLLFATRQMKVFQIEKAQGDNYAGGSNSENIGKDWETPDFVNPVPDFLGVVATWLDIVKRLVFLGMLWITLAIMFMTGTKRVNLFSMGYLIGSFIFLWQGTDFYLRPKSAILQWWSWLLRYNVSVVAVKTLLQIPGCIFSSLMQEHACWLVQLLGIGCVDKFAGGKLSTFIKMSITKEESCSVPQEDIGLAWDGVCFAFLILQRRLFHSYYFYRVIDESKATTVLASRGAELIEELRQKQMKVQEDQEVKILEKIKVKMERIKANQKKIQGVMAKEPQHHDGGTDTTDTRRVYTKRHEVRDRPWYTPPASHQKAVRSGDYYMFDEFDDTDINMKDDESSSDEEQMPREMGFGRLLSTAFKTDVKRAVSLRRASMPAMRERRLSAASIYPLSYREEVKRKPSVQSPREVRLAEGHEERTESSASDIDDYAPLQDGEETFVEKIKRIYETASAFISSIIVSLTRHLMKYSRDYRYVSRTLSTEKRILKEQASFGIGLREGSQMIWEPLPPTLTTRRKLSDISVPEIRILAPSMERGLDASPPPHRASPPPSSVSSQHDDDTSEHESAFSLQTTESKDVTILEEQDDSMLKQDSAPILYLGYALWYVVLAHTDIVCFIMVFINQIQSATILSIPLPLMVFVWGTLTIPRPTKTFWVTLIAYTEVIVLIKSMFQFEILPWNQKAIPANMPFTAPRIIGIERKPNYALYDLLLLLLIFFHRFMLKSLGLWKESTPDVDLREDMEYPMSPEDTQMVVEGRITEVGQKYIKLHDKTGPASAESSEETTPDQATVYDETAPPPAIQQGSEYDNEAGPSKPNDDDHYKFNDDQEPIIAVTTTIEDTYKHYPQVMLLSIKRYLRPTQRFFMRMLAPGARVTADIYAYMFLCDFFNFLVVIFGFAAFGTHQGDGGVQAYLEENKVPIPFLVMLILQFGLIVIDRALYLRKFMLGKILFQYALIIGVHIWMFFVLPFITERTFNALLPPPMWYMVKCVYLLLSAYQIRCGYPRRIIGNFLCKAYHFLNMIFFRAFMAIPFLFELRTLMDWIWTDTSMTLMDWLKMEDIFASVFLLKCSRYVEDEFPQPRGAKKSSVSKYLVGGTVLAFVIAIIWFPLVFFAFGNSVGEPNPPTDVTVKLRIGPFLPVYQMSAQSHNIDVFKEQDYTQLSNMYSRDRTAQTFLSNYMYNDIAVVTINPNSTMKWEISPPELERLEREAKSNDTLLVRFTYVITHPTNAVPNPPTIEDHREVPLEAYIDGHVNPERTTLLELLKGTATPDTWLNVSTLFPKFLKVFNKGTTKPAYQLMPIVKEGVPLDDDTRLYRDVQIRLERDNGAMYWRVREKCELKDALVSIPMNNCNMLVMYTFNDKLFPETLNFISGSGIIGLYTTFVFLASRVLRGFFSGIYTKIMFDDLPNVDRVLQLCLDIYLVREALELALEEDLFAKLVFLYRSPETMIKWSRPKQEEEEQRALTPSR